MMINNNKNLVLMFNVYIEKLLLKLSMLDI